MKDSANRTERRNVKIAACAANNAGIELVDFITQQQYPIQFIATCRSDNRECEEKIAHLASARGFCIYRDISANDAEFIGKIKDQCIDLMLLLWWPEIICKEAISAVNTGWVNNHPSLLPYDQGKHGYVWSIINNNPYGVTIHLINDDIDKGPILFQKEIAVAITDTGESLYKKSYREQINIFRENYANLVTLNFTPTEQEQCRSTYHTSKDIERINRIDLDKEYKARNLIDIIRAQTFTTGKCSYIVHNGERYYLQLKIKKAVIGDF